MNKPQNIPTVSQMPSLPRDEEGPVFKEPWEAEAFAMTLNLHAQGHFTWPEWAQRLGAEISAARDAGDADRGDTYYLYWLKALEGLVAEKGLLPPKLCRNAGVDGQRPPVLRPTVSPLCYCQTLEYASLRTIK